MPLSENSFILKNDGTLWGCGKNDYSILGLGNTSRKIMFTEITTNTNNIKSVYCGGDHAFILKNDGTLWACGDNQYGQLGLGDTTYRTTFTQVTTSTDNIKLICCGSGHTLMMKNDNTLWGCGRNEAGQLGLGDTTNRNIFTQITTNADNIKSIYCCSNHTFALKNNNTLWACGYNEHGRLGLGDKNSRTTFTQVTINADNIKSVYCGGPHAFILKNDGTLWGCGYNGNSQLGLGDTNSRTTFTQITTNTDNIKSVYCGYHHTLILKNDGTLWGCGLNDSGQLGLGDTSNRTTFTIIGINSGNIRKICCGYSHTFILKNDGTLWGCGYNEYGQLGLEDMTNRNIFTQITVNTDNIKCFANDYSAPSTIKIYDSKIGYAETLDTNNFRNIPINTIEKLKSLCVKPVNTYLNCLISFDKKQTWKTFDGTDWTIVLDISPQNIILNGMEVSGLNSLDKQKLISGGFTGDLDFKIAMKTNNKNKTPSVTKIYIEYK